MGKVYIVHVIDHIDNDNTVVGVTLEPCYVRDIINNYLHYRVQQTEEYIGKGQLKMEKIHQTSVWSFFRNYDFNGCKVGDTVFYGTIDYDIQVDIYEIYERFRED